ncbi:hypothetical protein A2316_01095 [Candidatus Falkowbacteria bacterium RIFOXYB2_FULL_38_15]|uniref:Uncharacterized protein n=1 Tax=Candidatus Falkowbacteria bacterium RIFOXYA2_FULL_38_12 TaxID=1797993 RepID=A0A1F5S5F1_9BACT|nr:MAG: hypothetical protein A2257_02500 [Candidatus Falkowbacteria bacterium RIFOXYA2_FULL_38_12]OGF32783.1 MAG: hypothetical protein A2316_01095 [Candidatus Falkowbacteria bacterium RIFOXYB2_FULL_38_15]OGF42181.1 MAG: hypothetical protein A2555_02800 [Candidatus Falkowbacteria bacterium RIFOXYD2_FULL_39_16]
MRQFTKKIILAIPLAVFAFYFALPFVANAALSPLTDTQCWTREMCLGKTDDCSYCFKEGEGQCSAPFGKCYHPHEPIDLQIKLGSTGQVTDMAEYISLAYSYVLSIGNILAVVIIIASGFIYLTAGGNPSRIGQAKEYIGGAVVGVILLFTSYLILNTLNPDLVRLKMPSIYMIRPADMPATFCADIDWGEGSENPIFYRADDVARDGDSPANPRRLKDYATATASGGREHDPENLTCNFAFYSPTIAGQSPCYGSGGCEPDDDGNPSVCAKDSGTERNDWFTCQAGNIAGEITYGNYPFDDDLQVSVMGVDYFCNDNSHWSAGPTRMGEEQIPSYVLPGPGNILSDGNTVRCRDRNTTLGKFYITIIIQENDTFDDSWVFYLGKSACINLSGREYSVTSPSSPGRTTGAGVRNLGDPQMDQSELWTLDELRNTVRCNLRIENRPDSFPITE